MLTNQIGYLRPTLKTHLVIVSGTFSGIQQMQGFFYRATLCIERY